MDVLDPHELDAVAGGMSAFAVVAAIGGFLYMNLDKVTDSYRGFVAGLGDGFNGTTSGDPTALCTP